MKSARLFTIVSLLIIFAFASVMVVGASSPHMFHVTVSQGAPVQIERHFDQAAPAPDLDDLLATLKNLGGFAILITALINVGKQAGWVKNGNAQTVSLCLNTLGLVVLVFLQITGKFNSVPVIDQHAGALGNTINAVLVLVFQLYVSRKGHENVLAGLPAIGKSFSDRRAGEAFGAVLTTIEE